MENRSERGIAIALFAFALTLPFGNDLCSLINNISVVLIGVLWLFQGRFSEKWRLMRQRPLAFLFIAVYLVYFAAVLYSGNRKEGLFEVEKKMSMLFLPLFLSGFRQLPRGIVRRLFIAFITACLVSTLICLGYAVTLNYAEGHTLTYVFNAVFRDIHLPGHYYYFNYWYFTYKLLAAPVQMHPVYLAMYLVFSVILAAWLWWDTSGRHVRRNVLVGAFAAYMFLFVVLLSSRTQLFIFALTGLSFALYTSYRRRKMLKGLIVTGAVLLTGILFILLNPVIRERIIRSNLPGAHFSENRYGEGGMSLRLHKWRYSLEAIGSNWLAGTGTGGAQDALDNVYRKHDFALGFENRFNPHNQFLQTWLETGLPGLIILLSGMFVPLLLSYRKKSWLYVLFLVVFILSCMTESMLQTNKGIAFYSFFNSLLAFHLADPFSPENAGSPSDEGV